MMIGAGVVALGAVVGVIVAMVVGGGDDGDDSTGASDPYRPVSVTGQPLPEFSEEMRTGRRRRLGHRPAGPDRVGRNATPNRSVSRRADDDRSARPLVPALHAEVPRLNEWRDSGEVPDGLNIVGVSTGVRPDAELSPDQWLVDKDWQWPVLADDESGTVMAASRPIRRWFSSTATATSSGGSLG